MSVQVAHLVEEEPPPTRAQRVVGKASQRLLYFICCVAPIAVFPVELAYKIWIYFFP
jgi:hypothetical protein